MEKFGVKKLVYSSSATVYGIPKFLPLTEAHPIGEVSTVDSHFSTGLRFD